jgi:hypothetical protein
MRQNNQANVSDERNKSQKWQVGILKRMNLSGPRRRVTRTEQQSNFSNRGRDIDVEGITEASLVFCVH